MNFRKLDACRFVVLVILGCGEPSAPVEDDADVGRGPEQDALVEADLGALDGGDDTTTVSLLAVVVGEADRAAVERFFETVPVEVQILEAGDAPDDESALIVHIDSRSPARCVDCYRFESAGRGLRLLAHRPLGLDYGLAHLLEFLGLRFFHPQKTFVPETLRREPLYLLLDHTFAPEMERRGLHLNTLRPIEGMFDFSMPSEAGFERARRVIDWLVKNRGNYLQWAALDNISRSEDERIAWRDHTARIVEEAHARGIEVGLGIQLFGQENMQNAFDLIDASRSVDPGEILARLAEIDDVGVLDVFSLSFGEFFAAEPEAFVEALDLVVELIAERSPTSEVAATIHVGNYPGLRVSYEEMNLLYYFLVQFADTRLVPWVHTVMYYTLFDDAGGAYLHDAFDEHRDFLLKRLRGSSAVAYHPESAYWAAFDNSVPTYLPLYIRSRWRDLAEIRRLGKSPLRQHILGSSGWEWGYWQNDYFTLRLCFGFRPWQEMVGEAMRPLPEGEAAAAQIVAMAELQHRALIEQRLAAYVAGRDIFIDGGALFGIVSQPDRVVFEELAQMQPRERAAFVGTVIAQLDALAEGTGEVRERVSDLDLGRRDPWLAELADGVAVTHERVRFVAALYRAVAAASEGATFEADLETADLAMATARVVVDARHAALHDPDPRRLLERALNPTIHDFGYLMRADELCYWQRERAQVASLIEATPTRPPGCWLQ